MAAKLKPCPFCGSKAVQAHHDNHNHSGWQCPTDYWVYCDGGDCAVVVGMYETAKEAIDNWNRRVS